MNSETLADIAREMCTYFQAQKRNGNPEHRPWHQVLSDWAVRLSNWDNTDATAHVVEFRLGYAKDAPRVAYDSPWYTSTDDCRHPEWASRTVCTTSSSSASLSY